MLNMVSMLNKKEGYIDFISYIVECFSAIANLGVRQMGVLREAIAYESNTITNMRATWQHCRWALLARFAYCCRCIQQNLESFTMPGIQA